MKAILLGAQGFWTELVIDDYPRTIEIPCLAGFYASVSDLWEQGRASSPISVGTLRFERIAISDGAPPNACVYMQVPGQKP